MHEQQVAHHAEQALLGGLLAGGDARTVTHLRAADFSDPRHQAIYLALAGTTGQEGGPASWLRGRSSRAVQQQAQDLTAYLDQLAGSCPDPGNLASYAAMIEQARSARAAGQPGTDGQSGSAADQLASAGAWLTANSGRGRRAAGSPADADAVPSSDLGSLAGALRPAVLARVEATRATSAARAVDTPPGEQAKGAQPGINRESLQRMVLADLMRHPADGRAAVARIPAEMFTAGPLRQLYEMVSCRIMAGQPVDPLIIAWEARQHSEPSAPATGAAARWTLSAIALRIGSTPTARGTTRIFGRVLLADHLLTEGFGGRWTQDRGLAARLAAPGSARPPVGPAAAVGFGEVTGHQAAPGTAAAGPGRDPAGEPALGAAAAFATGHPVAQRRGWPAAGPTEPGNGAAPRQ